MLSINGGNGYVPRTVSWVHMSKHRKKLDITRKT